jgi:eukaryotic-like serine/threonine-protein kinase
MFRRDGTLAIVDFGIVKNIAAADRTGAGEVLGTPRYMSPEQVQCRALDLRTDIYSAGVLLYRMLTGKHVFDGQTAMEIAMRHVNSVPPSLPADLELHYLQHRRTVREEQTRQEQQTQMPRAAVAKLIPRRSVSPLR